MISADAAPAAVLVALDGLGSLNNNIKAALKAFLSVSLY